MSLFSIDTLISCATKNDRDAIKRASRQRYEDRLREREIAALETLAAHVTDKRQ